MNFKLKSAVQWVLSMTPGSVELNRYMQLYVTKSLPISDTQLAARRAIAQKHLSSYIRIVGRPPVAVLDLGSGSDLAIPILMAARGRALTAADIKPLASERLQNDILLRVDAGSLSELGVEYIVYDPPDLPFQDNSFDLITSTSVLEHVPSGQVERLASELHRVLRHGGVSTHHIAHKDHWSDFDASLHDLNYLRYDERGWRRFNPPLLRQNRLLSSQYVEIFARYGFVIERQTSFTTPPPFQIAEQFARFSPEDLRTTHTWLTLTKG
ncbi:methyltransferase domain-containing protein [Methylosinus sporium]|uniref:class I SAM-dependent methyltransferase n=1 Tax=Methylosinus sporium TaxID=428 RepID=UPI00383AF565